MGALLSSLQKESLGEALQNVPLHESPRNGGSVWRRLKGTRCMLIFRSEDKMSQGDTNSAAVPQPGADIFGDDRWMSQHLRFVLDCKDKEPEVLFVGDSMVQVLQQYELWRELFSPLHALGFGIGGDKTEHLLWRLQNGELENIKPKVIVVWAGTNNIEHTAEEVVGGIEAIVKLINRLQPQAKIIVMGLMPRGEKPNPLRQKNAKVNQLLRVALPKLPSVQLLDVDVGFVHSDGTISCHDLFDFLHLTPAGYAKICKPLHELIMQLLEETPEEKQATLA
ncbi:platelet-activating factor acetylhydrolase IB subunit alpha2 isoform X1 [Pleurodeles waltl]|uniref:platelet-activating factor acetylhydrolase IB subunit alpha2 isoform X1 n=2 Tax=Pleurodeles waltl TaxID=8319 RepID=UPI003709BE44